MIRTAYWLTLFMGPRASWKRSGVPTVHTPRQERQFDHCLREGPLKLYFTISMRQGHETKNSGNTEAPDSLDVFAARRRHAHRQKVSLLTGAMEFLAMGFFRDVTPTALPDLSPGMVVGRSGFR